MRKTCIFLTLLTLLISCMQKQAHNTAKQSNISGDYSLVEITEQNLTPTVDIAKYSLITATKNDRRNDAEEILKLKRKWPLAMQSLNPLEFDSILGRNFTYKSAENFLTRDDYIKNRTTPDDWKITFVQYDNVTLQFFGDVAILSYRNHVRNENSITGITEVERISWVDIYIKENGNWKLGSTHSIDYSLEK